MSGARGVQCEKCTEPRDMGLYDIIQYDDGSTEWVLQCFECNTVQSETYDPNEINSW